LVVNLFQAARAERGGVAEERQVDGSCELANQSVTNESGRLGIFSRVRDELVADFHDCPDLVRVNGDLPSEGSVSVMSSPSASHAAAASDWKDREPQPGPH